LVLTLEVENVFAVVAARETFGVGETVQECEEEKHQGLIGGQR
jgi:hypothetical protein